MAQMSKIRRKMWWVFRTIFIFFRSWVLYATEMEHKRSISFGIIWSEYLGEQISSLNAIRVLAPPWDWSQRKRTVFAPNRNSIRLDPFIRPDPKLRIKFIAFWSTYETKIWVGKMFHTIYLQILQIGDLMCGWICHIVTFPQLQPPYYQQKRQRGRLWQERERDACIVCSFVCSRWHILSYLIGKHANVYQVPNLQWTASSKNYWQHVFNTHTHSLSPQAQIIQTYEFRIFATHSKRHNIWNVIDALSMFVRWNTEKILTYFSAD